MGLIENMVSPKRIIPCLDVDHGRVVKGVHFTNLRRAGDLVELDERFHFDKYPIPVGKRFLAEKGVPVRL